MQTPRLPNFAASSVLVARWSGRCLNSNWTSATVWSELTSLRESLLSETNLTSYSVNASIPKGIQDALIPVIDRTNAFASARSTHAHGNREPEFSATTCDGSTTSPVQSHEDVHDDVGEGAPFIIRD